MNNPARLITALYSDIVTKGDNKTKCLAPKKYTGPQELQQPEYSSEKFQNNKNHKKLT